MLYSNDGNNPNDIAIVGMALRVPGARNVDEFWANLRSGTESIRTLSVEELLEAGESPERIHHPNYVRRAAELPDMEMFDAEFFGLSPKEAAVMDPQHRHFLECAWEAMEDAGRMPDTASGPIGVFAGCGMGSYFYFNVCSNRALVDQVGMFLLRHTGNDKDFLATRASYTFDLRGPSVNVQTACSTSLVAIHYACQSLLNGESDMALAGGVTIEMPHRRGYIFQEGEILSPDGHCRAFDHRAAGTVFGSGVGVIALRRLSDALADGDVIHAVIKATAINNDGSTKAGYLAPSAAGQAAAIVEAQGLAGITADTVQYVECHGTGTALGDPIEIEALTEAFRQTTDRRGYCHVGSVKSNIGHLDTAAGVVGVIKTVLALKHGEIPPTLGYEKPNPAIDFASSPFVVNNELALWPATEGRRMAAVNSLGVGGTNAHAILEQAPERPREEELDRPAVILLSARHQSALDQAGSRLAGWLARDAAPSLRDTAYTLWSGRKRFEHNRLVAVRDRQDAIAALADPKRAMSQPKLEAVSGAVFLFPGGGAQSRRMAASLYRNDAFFRSTVDEGLSYLPPAVSEEVRKAWFDDLPAGTPDPLLRPSVQLPAILIVEVALARLWMRAGVKPAALIGHSMGENTAACIAGVLEFGDAVRLVRLRGELFDTIAPGGMLSVPLSGDEVRAILPDTLDIASVNAPGLSVVSGRNEDLEAFAATLQARDITATRVQIDIAAHSRMLDAILPRWEAFLRTLTLRAPRIPIVSNLTGDWLTAEQATDPMYWVRHLRSSVLFAEGMARLTTDSRRVYIEVGPGKTLSSLAKAQGSIPAEQVINSLPHPDDPWDDQMHFLTAIGRAAVAGLSVEQALLWGEGNPRRTTLPTYPFQHRRYFIEPAKTVRSADAEPALVKEPDMALWGYRPVWKQSLADYELGVESMPRTWLFFLDGLGTGAALVERLRAHGHTVTTVSQGDAFIRRSADDYLLCPELGASGYTSLMQALAADGRLPDRIVHLWLLTAREDARPGSNFFHRNQECGFYSLVYLAQAFADVEMPSQFQVTVVTNGMHRVGAEPLPSPEKATILGPGLVMPREIAGASVRLIDVELPAEPEETPRGLFARRKKPAATAGHALEDALWPDLLGAFGSEVVAYRNGKRWTRSHGRHRLDQAEAGKALLRKGGAYLFTGGLGDIATLFAGELAERFAARIVLLGRTPLPAREEWEAYRRQTRFDPIRHGIEAILRLEAKGAEVLYCRADVTNPDSMAMAIRAAQERFGRIDGVFHTAGVVDDAPMQAKTVESIEAVLAPKLLGTRVLDEALKDVDLDFCVLFSSTSTVTAPAGQVDYVAANAYLDAYAESCADLAGRRTISLHWGIWNELGLAARGTGQSVERDAIAETAPVGTFFTRWTQDETGLAWLEADIGPRTHWFLNEHRLVSGEAVLPGTAYFEILAQAAREHGIGPGFAVSDLVMLRPLVVPDGQTRTVQISLERSDDMLRATIRAGQPGDRSSFVKHAEAILSAPSSEGATRLDTAELRQRLPEPLRARNGASLPSAQERHISFGPRWHVLQSISIGEREALAELCLREEHRADIDGGVIIHPALLDIATGFAMPLIEAFRNSDVLWVPASYGKVRIAGPLPERLVSHVTSVPCSEFGAGYAAFDIVISDSDGNVVFEAERFLMKRLVSDSDFVDTPTGASATTAAREVAPAPSAAVLKLAAQVRQGILPSEGFEALVRALGSGLTQPIVSSMDLTALCQRSAAAPETAADASATFERPEVDSEFVAPTNPIEATLAGYWQELLGVSKVGIHDSFFDLGGHSLIAVRLFRMIKKQYGVDLPISVLFSAPTIAQCAALIAAEVPSGEAAERLAEAGTAAVTKHIHLTLMHPGKKPDANPLFICAGMFGNILNLRHLAQHLGSDRPVYGLQARGLFGEMEPHETFEEMAADYIAEIRSVRPHGPYLLAGYSGGGLTAYEMAQQLRAMGETVSHVILLDTPQPTQPPLSLADKLSMKSQEFRRHKFGYLNRWLQDRARWQEEMRRKQEAQQAQADGVSDQFNNEKIEAAFRRALVRYTVKPYDGPVTVYRPKPEVYYRLSGGRRLMADRNLVLDDNGWSEHVDQLQVMEVPGDHDSMVLEPHVRVLASHLRRTIEQGSHSIAPAIIACSPATSKVEKGRVTVPA